MIGQLSTTVQSILAQSSPLSPMEWRIRWDWQWPLWLSVLLASVVVSWIVVIYFREISSTSRPVRTMLVLLRLMALALAMAMFAQPAVEWFRRGRPRLVVLVDRSASMDTRDESAANGDLSRLEACKKILSLGATPLLEEWQSTYHLDVVSFDEQFVRVDSQGGSFADKIQSLSATEDTNTGTRLGDAVDYALRELPGRAPTAIILFSDGISTRGQTLGEAAQRARALRVPLYTVALGSPEKRADVAISNFLAEEVVFPGDWLQVEATLQATGYAGQSAKLVLREMRSNQVLAQSTVELPAEGAGQTVRLATRPELLGELILQLEVEPLDGERNLDNNAVSQAIEVSDEQIRVLIVQAGPSYEYRALKSLLERDPAIELRVHLQEADADFAEVDQISLAEFPGLEQELADYDVVLLGDVDPALLPSDVWERLEWFVSEHGRGLACLAGPRFMPHAFQDNRLLRVLLPFELEANSLLSEQSPDVVSHPIRPTELGWRTPSMQLGDTDAESRAIWKGLPSVSWLFKVESTKPGAQVLAEHGTQNSRSGARLPIILRHFVGRGEVLFHATDETWRWRWRTDDRYFARYWGQAVRRLGRGRLAADRQGFQLTTDRSRYRVGEEVQLQLRFQNPSAAPAADQGVVVQLQSESQLVRDIQLRRRVGHRGVFEAVASRLLPGKYGAMLLQPASSEPGNIARFEIEQPPRELASLATDRETLAKAAKISGGKSYLFTTATALAGELPPPRETTVEQLPSRPLWNTHAAMALFVVIVTSEWLLRRRLGML